MNLAVIHRDEQVLTLLKKFVEKIEEEEKITPRPSENVLFTTNPDDVLSFVKESPIDEAVGVISSGKIEMDEIIEGSSLAQKVKQIRPDGIFILYTSATQESNEYVDMLIENNASAKRTRFVAISIIELWQIKAVRHIH